MAQPPLTPPSTDRRKFCVTPTKTGYFGTDPPELAPPLQLPPSPRADRSPSSSRYHTPRTQPDETYVSAPRWDSTYNVKPSTSRMAEQLKQCADSPLPPHQIKVEPQTPPKQRCSATATQMMKRESPADTEDDEASSMSTKPSVCLPQIEEAHADDNACRTLLPTEHFCARLRQMRCEAADQNKKVPDLNMQMNEIFMQRLKDIDALDECNLEEKLFTYQDWVEALIQINTTLIMNIEPLEKEVKEVVQYTGNAELAKAQNDICKLLKFIQHAYHRDHWDLDGLNFETITAGQILGRGFLTTDAPTRLQSGRDATVLDHKHLVHLKALSLEVASKHDECCKMKKAIMSLEDEIQKAHKKIQLKGDVIRELRNDLRHALQQTDGPVAGGDQHLQQFDASAGLESARERLDASYSCLCYNEKVAEHKRRQLELELEELLILHKGKETVSTSGRQPIIDVVRRLNTEKEDALRRYDTLRHKLVNLDPASPMESHSSCSDFQQSTEMQNDAEIMNALRRRYQRIVEKNCECLNNMKKLEMDVKLTNVALNDQRAINSRNNRILREIADMLSQMSGEEFVYQTAYESDNDANPFLEGMRKIGDKYQLVLLQNNSNLAQQAAQINNLQQALSGIEKEKQQGITSNINTSTTTTITTKNISETTTTCTTTTMTSSFMEGEIQLTTTTAALPATPLTPTLTLLQIQQVSDIEP